MEYFFDNDPGFGNATQLSFTQQDTVAGLSLSLPIGALSDGVHQLFIRSKDANGKWSVSSRHFFYKYNNAPSSLSPAITRLEYFFDTDPGFGNGIAVSIQPDDTLSGININPSITSLSEGIHQLFIRSRDANGIWSITNQSFFYKYGTFPAAIPNLVAVEYFYDLDPGFGNGTPVNITPAQQLVSLPIAGDRCNLSMGTHRLFVRSKDQHGNWSVTNYKDINVQNVTYYLDNDHDGYGTSTDSVIACAQPAGYAPNKLDCNDTDSLQRPNQVWYTDADGDHYGTGVFVTQCARPLHGYVAAELIATGGDCNDNNAGIHPGAQYFTFSNTPGFTNVLCNPSNGDAYTTFQFEVIYFDASGNMPPATFPRVILDYENNGVFTNPNDRILIMTPSDANDLNTADGKKYMVSINSLPNGVNYATRIQSVANGCITQIGPFNYPDVLEQPDLEIFANDISFSMPNPPVASPLGINAVVHNVSGFAAQNIVVHLVNQYDTTLVYPDILIPFIPPYGTYTVSWNITTPSQSAWCPMQVSIDYTNVIAESNELDNMAIRPFINGNYNLPGGIVVNPQVSPTVGYVGSSTAVYGSAHYTGTSVPLTDSSVAGATVNFTIEETGASYQTYSNSTGNFSLGFINPNIPGIYHIQGTVTDFTLSATFSLTFEIISPVGVSCTLPDLSAQWTANSPYGTTAQNNQTVTIVAGDQLSCHIVVSNSGTSAAANSLLSISANGASTTPGNISVPALASAQSFTSNFSLTYPNPGNYNLYANADAGNTINECNENNGAAVNVNVLPALPDLTPWSGPGGFAYACQVNSVSFSIRNIGGAVSTACQARIIKRLNGVPIDTTIQAIPAIASAIYSNNIYSFSLPFTPTVPGNYTFELQCDLPNNTVVENLENNNTAVYAFNILLCQPNFTLQACESFDVTSTDGSYQAGSNIVLKGVVVNAGNLAYSGPLTVRFSLSGGAVYNETYTVNLNPGSSLPVTKTVSAPAPATQSLTISVDPDSLITEFSETDNSQSDQLCWDMYVDSASGCLQNKQFWHHNYLVNQAAYLPVGIGNLHLYNADTLYIRYEVSGPGLSGWVNLGDAVLYQVVKSCPCTILTNLPNSFVFQQTGTYTFRITVDPDNHFTECNESNNVLIRSVNVVTLPDMRVLSQHIAPSLLNPQPGQGVHFNISYQNIGYSNISDTMSMKVFVDNQLIAALPGLTGLLCGDNQTVAVPGTWSSNLTGIHVIRAVIDANQSLAELNETNNEATRAIVVGSSANLYFQALTTLNTNPGLNTTINVRARIGNSGDLDCNADLQLYYVDNNLDTLLFYTGPVSVSHGDSVNIMVPWYVADNKTTIIGKIVNSSTLEYTYDDNKAEFQIGGMLVVMTSTPACGPSGLGSITANVLGGEAPYSMVWNNGFVGSTRYGGVGTYSVTVYDATGQTKTASGNIVVCPPATLHTKLYLQGLYLGNGLMESALLNQGIAALPTYADSVTVALHDPQVPATVVESYKGILLTDGNMESYFSPAVNGNSYYVVVKHRNAIETWSANPVLMATQCTYDFSTSASQAYGDNQLLLDNANWGFYSGDINQDQNIDLLDLSLLDNDISAFQFGYYPTDINGDGNVDLLDNPAVDASINAFIYAVHP